MVGLRESIRGFCDLYKMVWEEVNKTDDIKDLPVELRKDIATSVFIQMARPGSR